MDPKTYEPQKIVYRISDAKSNLVGPEELSDYGYSYIEKATATVYKLYQKRLEQGNLLDFDDLIALVIRLFDKCPEVEEHYSSKFEHVLVDEYQDVNKMQYELVKRLSKVHGNVTVVGDDDQSIYAFRGANSKLILGFEKDYPGATVVKLEQNYRSTQSILDAANSLVARNRTRFAKKLWTNNGTGTAVRLFEALTPEEEAGFVASSIDALVRGGADPRDMAVIYRMNSQSRADRGSVACVEHPLPDRRRAEVLRTAGSEGRPRLSPAWIQPQRQPCVRARREPAFPGVRRQEPVRAEAAGGGSWHVVVHGTAGVDQQDKDRQDQG